jgi:hypothetical protein
MLFVNALERQLEHAQIKKINISRHQVGITAQAVWWNLQSQENKHCTGMKSV